MIYQQLRDGGLAVPDRKEERRPVLSARSVRRAVNRDAVTEKLEHALALAGGRGVAEGGGATSGHGLVWEQALL